jgi:hypothetical protein
MYVGTFLKLYFIFDTSLYDFFSSNHTGVSISSGVSINIIVISFDLDLSTVAFICQRIEQKRTIVTTLHCLTFDSKSLVAISIRSICMRFRLAIILVNTQTNTHTHMLQTIQRKSVNYAGLYKDLHV